VVINSTEDERAKATTVGSEKVATKYENQFDKQGEKKLRFASTATHKTMFSLIFVHANK
jgi:hypothetical protein